ncbi:MAG: hypothetical protein IJD22_01195, partial [Clostridia bacterium]|nr:hypothetical protein [Clostridia bacterium]
TVWSVLFAIAAAIVLIANAIEKIVKVAKAARAPGDRQDERLAELEKWKDKVERRLSNDDDRLLDIEKGDRATQRALLALLDHGIDGNNIKQMQDAKEELQNHLINR